MGRRFPRRHLAATATRHHGFPYPEACALKRYVLDFPRVARPMDRAPPTIIESWPIRLGGCAMRQIAGRVLANRTHGSPRHPPMVGHAALLVPRPIQEGLRSHGACLDAPSIALYSARLG